MIDNLSNSQWYLLAGAVLVVFWDPAHWPGRIASPLVVFVAATTSPFAGLAAALAVVGWLVDRRPRLLPIAVAGLVGLLVQGWVVVHAPARDGPMHPGFDLESLVAGYLRRVVADGVLGSGRHGHGPSPSVVPGLLVSVAVAVLVAAAISRRRTDALLFPATLIGCSIVLFAAPAALTQWDTTQAYTAGRYWVAPVILLVTALSLLAEDAWLARDGRTDALPAVVAAVTVVACLAGIATSWWVPSWDPRHSGPSWQSQVEKARQHCQQNPSEPAVIRVTPHEWSVTLTCADLR